MQGQIQEFPDLESTEKNTTTLFKGGWGCVIF